VIRVIVCAAPAFTNQRTVDDALDAVLSKRGPFVLLCGRVGAEVSGASLLSLLWAASRGVEAHPYPAGPLPGADAAVAFPGGDDMAARAEAAGVPVWRVPARQPGPQPYRGPA